jgi:tripartite-type tricarboxylate transporter receptor subunit TctC
MIARMVAAKLQDSLGQTVIVDNRGGANGMIGSSFVANAAPDGYTLLAATPASHVTAVHLMKNLPVDPVKDFTPIMAAVEPVTALVVNADLPVNSVPELIAYAKANPGKLSYGSSGVGSVFHLTGELFNRTAGVNITHVPYKGTAPALTDTISGQIDGLYTTTISAESAIKSGRAKVLGVAGPKRAAVIPDVPTLTEQGIKGADNLLWIGLVTTAKVPRTIVEKLNREVNRILQLPDVKQRFEQLGIDPEGGTPERFDKFIKAQAEGLRTLIKSGVLPVE